MRGIVLIQVGETLDARRGLSRKILVDTLVRQAALVLAVATLVWFAVRLVLRPLMRLKLEIERRALHDMSDVDPALVHKEVRPLVLRPLMRLKSEVENRALGDLSDVDQALVHKEVRPLVAALNDAMSRMQLLIASQRRFIADASHQLRTPLTVLKTQAEMALRSDDPQAMREIVRAIAATTDSTVHLANRLLTLARIEHGENALEGASVSLADTARRVGLDQAPQAVKKHIDLACEALAEAPVSGQALMLQEMISNLVDNAIRYTPPGGRVVIRVRESEGCMLLEVEDTGCGIAEAEREKVFTPFCRASASFETNPGGTGLGLAIVRDIAVAHRAVVTLHDAEPGPGLRVQVRFPPIAG